MSTSSFSAVRLIAATANQTAISGTTEDPIVGIASDPILPGTGSFVTPIGTTAQRLLRLGAMRLNTTTGFFECSADGATWVNLAVGGGGVATVTGTANRITSTGGANPVIDIAGTYVGQASITTLGTITTGIWNAGTVTTAQVNAGNLQLSTNDLISTNINGNINIVPNGTGSVTFLTGGGVILTTTSQLVGLSQISVGNLHLLTNLIEATNPGGSITLLPDGAGVVNIGSTATASSEIRLYEMTGGGTNYIGLKSPNALAGDTTYILPIAFPAVSGYVLSSDNAGNMSWAAAGAGSVTSVSGTANRITSTGGTTPVIDISAAYVGQTSITTLGTITTGTWNGSVIDLTYGGTNANLTASNGGIVWSNATQMQILAGTATASKMLLSGATATPSWSTSTIPTSAGAVVGKMLASDGTNYVLSTATFPVASAAAGKIIRSDGTNWIASTATFSDTYTASNLLYSNGANTVTGLATANNGLLVTSNAGVPSILGGPGTTGQVLQSNAAAAPSFSTASYPSTTTINQLLYSSAANTVTGLATANTATLVTSSTGVPSLLAITAGSTNIVNAAGTTFTSATIPGRNMIINGDMKLFQRGASGSAVIAVTASTTVYTADRWQVLVNANQTSTVTQAAGATTQSYIAQVQRNNGQTGTGVMRFCTSLEINNCIGAAGNIVTLSFKAKCGANFSPTSNNITVTVYSGTGTTSKSGINGAYTGSATPISQTQALTTTLTNYTFSTAALGATITQLAVEFSWTPTGTAGADDSAFFTDVQLEISPNQTAFDRRTFAEQLTACRRYYYKTFQQTSVPAQNVGISGAEIYWNSTKAAALGMFSGTIPLPVPMQTTSPTITLYNPAATNAQARDVDAGADCSATVVNLNNGLNIYIGFTGNAGTVVGNRIGINFTADAELT